MTTCKQPKPSEKLQSTAPVHQGFKPLAHSPSRLKTTELLILSPLQRTLAMRQGFKPLADDGFDGMTQPNLELGAVREAKTDSSKQVGLGKGYLYLLQRSMTTKSSGFTIIECLLAIILVGILMTAVAPVMVLSVATRVQARRVEQATMAARSYIDAVQSGTVSMPENTVLMSEVDANNKFTSDRASFAQVAAPPSTPITCPSDITANPIYPYCNNDISASLYCVDNDGGGCVNASPRDYIVQAFRSIRVIPSSPGGVVAPPDTGTGGYVLGVRVYRADAFDGAATLQTINVNNGKKVATYAGGKGNQFAPLVELTTEVRPNIPNSTLPVPGVTPSPTPTAGSAMNSLCERLGGCEK